MQGHIDYTVEGIGDIANRSQGILVADSRLDAWD